MEIAVIGMGRMGCSIADFLLEKGLQVTAITRSPTQADKLNQKWVKRIQRELKFGVINTEQANVAHRQFVASSDLQVLTEADMVIESVTECLQTKQSVYQNIVPVLKNGAILASNSSSILPEELAQRDLIGLHFFFPVANSGLVELVTQTELNQQAQQQLDSFMCKTGLTAIPQDKNNAFLLNMLSMAVGGESFEVAQRFGFAKANQLAQSAIFPLGPFELFDHVGIPVVLEATQRYFARDPLQNKASYQALMQFMTQMMQADSSMTFAQLQHPSDLASFTPPASVFDDDDAACAQRLLYLHINSCLFAVEQGLIEEELLDTAIKAVMGTDIGPLQLAHQIGFAQLHDALSGYYQLSGQRYYQPSTLLEPSC